MKLRGRTLRFAAVSAAVVLCLTGFSTGRGHGRGGGGGDGGGCSSSSQNHDSSSSSTGGGGVYKDDGQDDSYGRSGSYGGSYGGRSDNHSSSGSSGTSKPEQKRARVKLLSCATEKEPYATVEVTNLGDVDARFVVTVSFKDAHDVEIVSERKRADVSANGRTTVRVPVSDRDHLTRVDHCDLDPEAPPVG